MLRFSRSRASDWQAAFNATNFCHWLGLSTQFVSVPFGVFCIAIISSCKSCCVHSKKSEVENSKHQTTWVNTWVLTVVDFTGVLGTFLVRVTITFLVWWRLLHKIYFLITLIQLLDHHTCLWPPSMTLSLSCLLVAKQGLLGKHVDSYTIETYTQTFQGY